ncbi:hypothetical protein AJ80_08813 [Polytolypa hystricis UAMH7299]|uniref:DNA 3'-5' helicase n=1 Tax=Polytolypa hystricis (strain UAMH7299) TaxID=1447883 RepID=A0A2B7X0Y5_POLH7|nr:hypothetical protein AJ80_08813 [Polytolypa hystricis UAMH7299]
MDDTSPEVRQFLHTFRNPALNRSHKVDTKQIAQDRRVAGYNSPTREVHRRPLGLPSTHQLDFRPDPDDDIPFDAFDKELLAQLPAEKQQPIELDELGLDVPDQLHLRRSAVVTLAPKTNSRFFQASPSPAATPFRGLASSSSELGPLSSPSMAVANQKRLSLSPGGRVFNENTAHPRQSFSPINRAPSPVRQGLSASPAGPKGLRLAHAPPMVQGIQLVSTHDLPDRFRSLFPFPVFNGVQSKCFPPVYQGDHNFVLSAPTGSGKTVIMELAICRLVNTLKDSRFKVVYQAPTKSLCSERFRDWQAKFSSLDLQCAELTGDTDYHNLRNVQSASIIITTPEKWDSMTRKWKDHAKLMQLVKLFLIDEVHILKESRGATLEAVVSRMKSVDSNVRFVALSATVPNSEDIAAWLGRDPTNQQLPAHRERFGEEFRPVKLQKFVYGYQSNGNDFVFDKVCEAKLPEMIAKHSRKKPIMIFCCTRNSCIATSKYLAKVWSSTSSRERSWSSPTKTIAIQNADLRATVSCGVAFHHAGLDSSDRHSVETGFLEGHVSVICCTSTLAVGVNLPCHLVIIKNTVSWQDNACKEYSDLEMMQMLGRAGRPQFDDSAVAVILTKRERIDHYEKLVAGTEPLESCLHMNLIDHLNAEIGLGTITDIVSAVRWLAGTFFFIRLRQNPSHYNLKEGADRTDEEDMLREICEKDIELLQDSSLVTNQCPLKATEFGEAMARYYIKFETMKLFLFLPPKPKMSEILSAIAQADEFREIRLKSGEKSLYKEINKGNGIKFPIKVNIALPAHKISLVIQAELGAVDIPTGDQYQKHRLSFQQDKGLVFSHINRLIRCIIDCQLSLEDSVGSRHALELARSFGARVWDNSPVQMKQIDQVGIVAVRKLANSGINSIEALESTDAQRIDMILSKNPPFGAKLLGKLAEFPKLRVSVKLMGKDIKPGKHVRVRFKADIGFMNEKPPVYFRKRPVYVCFLAETSDGRLVDFRRFGATKLQNGQEILLTADLTHVYQHISCYVMCDEIAGTLRQAELKHDIPTTRFPAPQNESSELNDKGKMNTSRRRSNDTTRKEPKPSKELDEFEDGSLDYRDLIAAAEDMDCISLDGDDPPQGEVTVQKGELSKTVSKTLPVEKRDQPVQLENGKWACNHKCKDKSSCKHYCCREGLDRPPKVSKAASTVTASQPHRDMPISAAREVSGGKRPSQKQLSKLVNEGQGKRSEIEVIDLCGGEDENGSTRRKPPLKSDQTARASKSNKKHSTPSAPTQSYSSKISLRLSLLDEDVDEMDESKKEPSSDYGSAWLDDLPSISTLIDSAFNRNDEIQATERALVDPDDVNPIEESDEDDDLVFYADDDVENELSPILLNKVDASNSAGQEATLPSSGTGVETQTSQLNSPVDLIPAHENMTIVEPSSDSLFFHSPTFLKNPPQKRNINELGEIQKSSKPAKMQKQREDKEAPTPRVTTNTNDKQATSKSSEPAPQLELHGWEGIDPSLLDEFKDIVNFI